MSSCVVLNCVRVNPKQHDMNKFIIFVSNFFSGCQWSPLHSPCLRQRSDKTNYIDGQQLANSPVLCLRPDWKVFTPSLVQINLCLLTFAFKYSAAPILNHSTTGRHILEGRMCYGQILLGCTQLRLQERYQTLLKGMLSAVWFHSLPGSLFPPPLSLHFQT